MFHVASRERIGLAAAIQIGQHVLARGTVRLAGDGQEGGMILLPPAEGRAGYFL
jgi:hypothetical protein